MNESLAPQDEEAGYEEPGAGAGESGHNPSALSEEASGVSRVELEDVKRRLGGLWSMIEEVITALEQLRDDLARIDEEWRLARSGSGETQPPAEGS